MVDTQPEKETRPDTPKFTLKPVKVKPARRYRKGSKYDAIIDAFLEGKDPLVDCTIEGRDANYIRTQLNKRIEAKNLVKKMKTSVTNNVLYLEKI
jgi:hypothetical protein